VEAHPGALHAHLEPFMFTLEPCMLIWSLSCSPWGFGGSPWTRGLFFSRGGSPCSSFRPIHFQFDLT
jgi:hypothetical protein